MRTLFSRFLTLDGDGSTIQATGDYSGQTAKFSYTTDPDRIFVISAINVILSDNGTIDSGGYGNGDPLANGIIFKLGFPDGLELPLNTDLPIKTNTDWLYYSNDINIYNFGTGTQYMKVNGDNSSSGYYIIDGSGLTPWSADKIIVELNDNFTNLVGHVFQISGSRFTTSRKDIEYLKNQYY